MKPNDVLLPGGIEVQERLYELFHENSKRRLFELELRTRSERSPGESFKPVLNYGSAKVISLEKPGADHEKDMEQGFDRQHILNLFQVMFQQYESAGSGGSLIQPGDGQYPLEVFFWHPGSGDFDCGLYYLNPLAKTAGLVHKSDLAEMLQVLQFTELKPGLVIFISAVFERRTHYLGDRGYRYCCMEAGQAMAELYRHAMTLGYGTEACLEFHDNSVHDFLGIDGVTHAVLGLLCLDM